MLTAKGENPAGFGVGVEKENYDILIGTKRLVAPSFKLNTTFQTYYRMFMWQPFNLWKHLSPTPVLLVVPELDKVSPAELHFEHFEKMAELKRVHIEPGKGHMDVLSGESFQNLMGVQVTFIREVLAGHFPDPQNSKTVNGHES